MELLHLFFANNLASKKEFVAMMTLALRFVLRSAAPVKISVKRREIVGTNSHARNLVVIIPLVLHVKMNALKRDFAAIFSSVLTNVIRNVLSVNNQFIKNCLVATP